MWLYLFCNGENLTNAFTGVSSGSGAEHQLSLIFQSCNLYGPAMISSLKEQINSTNKPEVNKTLQIQFDAIRSVDDDIEKVDSMILQKKALLKESKDVHEPDRLFAELDGLEMVAAANRERYY
jgi:hypothetical protein